MRQRRWMELPTIARVRVIRGRLGIQNIADIGRRARLWDIERPNKAGPRQASARYEAQQHSCELYADNAVADP